MTESLLLLIAVGGVTLITSGAFYAICWLGAKAKDAWETWREEGLIK